MLCFIQSQWAIQVSWVKKRANHLGAGGVGLGRVLITDALSLVKQQYPSVETFQTLSPIKGFRSWLETSHPSTSEKERQSRCLEYLQRVRQRTAKPTDPVAAFHYGNGAILDRVLPNADPQYITIRLQ